MKCQYCGFESTENFNPCPSCGANTAVLPVSLNPAADCILPALLDPKFLVICILMTVSTVFNLISGIGLPLINVLFSIFLWLTYSAAKKGFADEKQLKNLSGTVYANYIIANVTAVLLFITGIIFGVSIGFVLQESGAKEELFAIFSSEFPPEPTGIFDRFIELIGPISFILFAVSAVLILVINICFTRKIHLFAKSVYKSVENCELKLVNVNSAKIALYVLGSLTLVSCIASLGNIFSLISVISSGVAQIIAATLINKYCINNMYGV